MFVAFNLCNAYKENSDMFAHIIRKSMSFFSIYKIEKKIEFQHTLFLIELKFS